MATTGKSLPGTGSGSWSTNPSTGVATNSMTGATFQAANPAFSGPGGAPPGGGGGGSVNVNTVGPSPVNYNNSMAMLQNYQSMYQSMLQSQREALEAQYQARTGQIETSYSGEKQGIQDTGGRISGSLKRLLGRAGGFTTTAGAKAVQNQQQSVQNQIVKLGQARDDAMAGAMAAKQSGMSDIYEKNLNAMFQIQKQMSDIVMKEEDRRYQEKIRQEELAERLALAGYSKIGGPSGLTGLKEDDITRIGDTDIYRNPVDSNTSIVDIGGRKTLLTYDSKGSVVNKTDLGASKVTGGSGTKKDKDEKDIPDDFWNDAEYLVKNNLQKAEEWGPVWDRLRAMYPEDKYPSITRDVINTALGGSVEEVPNESLTDEDGNLVVGDTRTETTGWANKGHYEWWKEKQYKQSNPTEWATQSPYWEQIAKLKENNASDEEITNYLMVNQQNPNDFKNNYGQY